MPQTRIALRHPASAAALLAILALPGCGKSKSSPTAGSSPAAAASAAPTPAPIPSSNLPGAASCGRIGLGQDTNNCPMTGQTFQADVEQAIEELKREQADIFENSPGGLIIVSPGRFYVGIINKLDRKGLCAGFDSEELQVKSSNAFNDQFALRTSSGFLRSGPSIYRATCVPAAFPTPRPPFPPNNGCRLAPSIELTCTRESPNYLGDVERSIDDVMRQHPEVFDFNIHPPGSDWPGVNNPDLYHQYMLQSLIAKGFCAVFDGAEIQIKKTSDFSEHYSVFYSLGYVRRGEGSYRSTCWPAAF